MDNDSLVTINDNGTDNLTVKEDMADNLSVVVRLNSEPTNDNRSYHISSEKIRDYLGFVPVHRIRDAVEGLRDAFEQDLLPNSLDDEKYFNIKRMQSIELS